MFAKLFRPDLKTERFLEAGNGISIAHHPGKTITSSIEWTRTAYGSTVIESIQNDNKYIWKLKINKIAKNGEIRIGIANASIDRCNSDFAVDCHALYAYSSVGTMWSTKNNATKYGSGYKKGDTVTVCADMKQRIVSFTINENHNTSIPFNNIEQREGLNYRFAVALTGEGTSIERTDYSVSKADEIVIYGQDVIENKINDEADEKKQEQNNNDLEAMYEELQNELVKKISLVEQYEQQLELKTFELTKQASALAGEQKTIKKLLLEKKQYEERIKLMSVKQQDTQQIEHKILMQTETIKQLQSMLHEKNQIIQNVQQEEKKSDDGIEGVLNLLNVAYIKFTEEYNGEKLQQIFDTKADKLMSEDSEFNVKFKNYKKNVSKMSTLIKSFEKYIEGIDEIKSRLSSPDPSKYKQWDVQQIIAWIRTLENGRFDKYIDILEKGFTLSGISGADLPELDRGDLSNSPFNIDSFKDKKQLITHFQTLQASNQSVHQDMGNEGVPTEYIEQ